MSRSPNLNLIGIIKSKKLFDKVRGIEDETGDRVYPEGTWKVTATTYPNYDCDGVEPEDEDTVYIIKPILCGYGLFSYKEFNSEKEIKEMYEWILNVFPEYAGNVDYKFSLGYY